MRAVTDFFEATRRDWRARLAISVDVMRELSCLTDPEEMYRAFARRMGQLFPTSRQLTVSRRGLEDPEFRVLRYNLWKDAADPYKEPHRLPTYAGGLFAELLYADMPQVIDRIELAPGDPAAEFLDGQHSLLSIPVYEDGAAVNTLIVTREEAHAFPREQVPDLVWMTNLFGRAMLSQVLSGQLASAYENADYELRVIAEMQQSLLPQAVPKLPGLDIAVHYRTPLQRAGGDYYDFFPLGGGMVGILIADVSGHGSPAAVLMAITHSLAHSYPDMPLDPGKFLGHLNGHLSRRYVGTSGHFVTAFYAVFDVALNEVTYANAGHLAPRVLRAGARPWEALAGPPRRPRGVSPGQGAYPVHSAPFGPGDRVILYTDGVVDAADVTGDRFGTDRLDDCTADALATSQQLAECIIDEIDKFAGPAAIPDDQTMVVVGRAP
jgi:sigma-B regulation protein RsbU (phosphoserine phosphatase)